MRLYAAFTRYKKKFTYLKNFGPYIIQLLNIVNFCDVWTHSYPYSRVPEKMTTSPDRQILMHGNVMNLFCYLRFYYKIDSQVESKKIGNL